MPKKLTACIVGCGGISAAWLRPVTARKDITVTGLVDLNQKTAEARAEEFGLKEAVTGTDLKKVLKATSPDIVFNCTIPEAHLEVTLEAFRQGCHVFSEKPLADSMKSARRMVKAGEKAGKLYAIMQNRRFDPRIRAVTRAVQSGKLGKITTVDCDFMVGAHFGGFREKMLHVLLLDMAIHTFDAARLIMQADPRAVYCNEWNPPGSWYAHGASAVAVFEMTKDIVYTYRGSWCAEGMNTTWESNWRIVGTKGSIVWDGADTILGETVSGRPTGLRKKTKPLNVPIRTGPSVPQGGHIGAITDFIKCLRTGKSPETIGSDNIKSLAMVFGAIESADKKERVRIRI